MEAGQLRRLRRGELSPAEVLKVTTHLANCGECRDGDAEPSASHADGVLDDALRDSSDDHPDFETLTAFVDGQLPFDEHDRVDAHLGICDRCTSDVGDLRGVAASMEPRSTPGSRWRFLAIAAALIVAIVTGLLLLRPAPQQGTPPVTPTSIASTATTQTMTAPEPALPPKWAGLVAETLRAGRIMQPAALRALYGSRETVRGDHDPRRSAVSPAEEIVESDRPTFTWPAAKGSESVVFVYRDDDELAVSKPVRGTTWTPAKPLPRGVPLVWQVEVRGAGGAVRIVPLPPDPPAMFRILDESSLREIAEAKRVEPRNDLLVGILYARAGLKERAIEALKRHASRDPAARSLLESVESWP